MVGAPRCLETIDMTFVLITGDLEDVYNAPISGSIEMISVFVWPDGTWVRKSEYEDVLWQSAGDDYKEVYFPDDATDEEIDKEVHEQHI